MFIKKLFFIFLWILIISGAFIFLCSITNIGVYLIFHGMQYCIPEFTFHTVSGNWKNFYITNVKYHNDMCGTIKIGKCNMSLNLKYLWNKRIYFDHCLVQDVLVESQFFNIINLSVSDLNKIGFNNILNSIVLKNLMMRSVGVISDKCVIKFKKINTGLIFQDNLLTIFPTYIYEVFVNVFNVSEYIKKIHSISSNPCNYLWNVNCIFKYLSDELLMVVSVLNLSINVISEKIVGENLFIFSDDSNKNYIINNFCVGTSLYDNIINVDLNISLKSTYIRIIGSMSLDEQFPINFNVRYFSDLNNFNKNDVNSNYKGIEKFNCNISGKLSNIIYLFCDYLNRDGGALHFFLKTKVMQSRIPVTMSIVGRRVSLYFLKKKRFFVKDFNIFINGEISNNCIQIISTLNSINFAPILITVNFRKYCNDSIISNLKVQILNGYFELKGIINWGNTIIWNNFFCIFHNMSFISEWFGCSGTLSGTINTEGYLSKDKWDIRIPHININGYINNKNILCIGSIYSSSFSKLKVPVFLIKHGENELNIKGELNENYAFHLILKVPDCGMVFSEVNGSVYGRCKLHGSAKLPVLSLIFDIDSLCWKNKKICNLFIKNMKIKGNIFCNAFKISKMYVFSNEIRYGNILFNKLIMQIQGNRKNHFIGLIFNNESYFGNIRLFGNLDCVNKIWQVEFIKAYISTPIGIWKLQKDNFCTYYHSIKKIIFDSHVWKGTNITIPILHNIFSKNFLKKVNALFQHSEIFKLRVVSNNVINVNTVYVQFIDFSWVLGSLLPNGNISLLGIKLNIKSDINSQTVLLYLDNINIKFVLTKIDLLCKWNVNIVNNSVIYGTFQLCSLFHQPIILGNFRVKNVLLEHILDSFFQLEKCIDGHGELYVNIDFYGDASFPKIYGCLELKNFNIIMFNTMYSCVEENCFLVNFFGNYVVLNSILNTRDGHLNINGNINLYSIENLELFLHFKGNNLNIYVTPQIQMNISPNIVCRFFKKKLYINGNLDIPWARIENKEENLLYDTIEISSEELLLDDQFQPIFDDCKSNLNIFIESNVIINFGNNVIFIGSGFDLKLRGTLEVRYTKKSNLILTGCIDIPCGYIKIYGQSFIIKKGQLLFSGAITQPYLDIEVAPNVFCDVGNEYILESMHITGILDNPKLEFFSNSSLFSHQKIISYLLGGYNLIISDTNADKITSLLIGMGISHSDKLIDKLGEFFGIRNLTLNTQSMSKRTSLTLNGYITPRLQISYGIGIFDLSTTMTARYCFLFPKLYLEVKSGHNQMIDLLYKFSF